MKILPLRRPPDMINRKTCKPKVSKENVVVPRSLEKDVWAINVTTGVELGRVTVAQSTPGGVLRVVTTKTEFTMCDATCTSIYKGVDVAIGDEVQLQSC